MTPLDLKLEKAQEFLTLADVAVGAELWDAGSSLAAISAINAADALTLRYVGSYPTGRSHTDIFPLLRRCGGRGTPMARHLRALLKVKSKAQYDIVRCTKRDAVEALRHARRAYDLVVQDVPKGN